MALALALRMPRSILSAATAVVRDDRSDMTYRIGGFSSLSSTPEHCRLSGAMPSEPLPTEG